MTHGSLFAGIGGFDLGFERAGFETVWQVEINEFCRKVLAKNFPHAQRFGDIRECGKHNLQWVDVITGGFPCQPFSSAGRRMGTADNRYLWPEMFRIISALRPNYVVAENVSGFVSLEDGRVLDQVYANLEGEGYETLPPLMVPACAFAAPHRRDRVWVIAHAADAAGDGRGARRAKPKRLIWPTGAIDGCSTSPDSYPGRESQPQGMFSDQRRRAFNCSKEIEIPEWAGGEIGQPSPLTEFTDSDPTQELLDRHREPGQKRRGKSTNGHGREIERDFRGMAHGVSRRVDRLSGLGNAVVPQIAEYIGRAIKKAEESYREAIGESRVDG